MSNLKQNNLEESTTDLGFVRTINENKGETIVALEKQVELEDGTTVTVEGITPSKMKQVLNSMVDGNEGSISYVTPGEVYVERDGVVQKYNDSVVAPDLVKIEVTTVPTKTTYFEGDNFDPIGMVVTATYNNETTKEITDYTVNPSENLATTDTSVTISYEGKTTTQEITVNAVNLVSIEITTPPTKTEYTVGETFDPTGMIVTGTYTNGNTAVVEPTGYTPDLETALTIEDASVIVSVYELTATQAITVVEAQNEEPGE